MENIVRLFVTEIKKLFSNTVATALIVGLVIVPSIFAWYNVLACWNVFDNTGNLKVAVANSDEGYQSDLVPLRINVGDRVVDALRANDQIDWVITDEEDAIDGARAGRYYAAVVIPASFSRDMLTFYSEDMEHARIIYYANEKKSAIAPKITDQGADTISAQVNQVFAETLSEVMLSIAGSLTTLADEEDLPGAVGAIADRLDAASRQMGRIGSAVSLYAPVLETAEGLVGDTVDLAQDAHARMKELQPALESGASSLKNIAGTLSSNTDALASALDGSSSAITAVSDAADKVFDRASADASDIAAGLRSEASSLTERIEGLRTLADRLEALAPDLPEQAQSAAGVIARQLREAARLSENLQSALNASADRLESGQADIAQERADVKAKAQEAADALRGLKSDYDANLKQPLEDLTAQARSLASKAKESVAALDGVSTELSADSDSAIASLQGGADKLREVGSTLDAASEALGKLADEIRVALTQGDLDTLRSILGSNVESLSRSLATPVGVERIALYPVANFGSAMAPLYNTLAIFIGSLLIMVLLKPKPPKAAVAKLDDPKPRQLFLGHFLICGLISFAQTTLMSLGNMLLLDVQVDNPALYLLCYWFAGFVFTFVIYSLVVSFANLGKAIAVLLLIVQVTGCGGSFPLQIMPQFVQLISPWLPATHVVNAMRSAMLGLYGNDYWIQMGELALFLIPAALLGLVLRKPLEKFMEWYVEKVESSKLIA